MRNATPPCLDTFCRLDRLGLSVTAQRVEPDHTVLRCRPTTPPSPCPGCAGPGVRHDAVLRRLAHVPFGWKPTILEVVVPRYRCVPCRRIWRHSITAAAPSKGKLARGAIMLAVKSIVVDRMSIARVAANLGVAWNTAADAILTAGTELLIDSADRLDGVTTVGVDEHVWRHTRHGDKYVCESLGGWSGTGWQGWSLAVHPDVTRSTCGPSRCLHSDLSVRVNGRRRARPTAVA